MKILIDPIYTNDPHFCSWSWKMKVLLEYLLPRHPDLFVYYCLPGNLEGRDDWEISKEWLLPADRVEYIDVPAYADRMMEYQRLDPKLHQMLGFYGPRWDWDILITARATQTPVMRALSVSIGANAGWSKRIIVVEDMPVMSFKKCVGQSAPKTQDIAAITGYLAADANLFQSFWEKDAMLRVARQYLSPSTVRELADKSFDSSSIQFKECVFKADALIAQTQSHEKPFTIGYTQRFEAIHRRSNDVMDVFMKQWVMHSGKTPVRVVATSNSMGGKVTIDECIEVLRPPREEFWRMMREEVDVVLVMSIDDAYPLSLLEPIFMGTPVVVLDVPYARASLGADYPFYIANVTEAYGTIRAFHEDYPAMYSKFRAWAEKKFTPLMTARNDQWLPLQVEQQIELFTAAANEGTKDSWVENSIVQILRELGGDEFTVMETLKEAGEKKLLRHLDQKLKENVEEGRRLVFMTDWNRFRLTLQYGLGYKDASVKTGHLRLGAA